MEYQHLNAGEHWAAVHRNRARRLARINEGRATVPDVLEFEHQSDIVTLIPGRTTPLYSRLCPNGKLVPRADSLIQMTASSSIPKAPPTTATHSQPPSKVLARFKKIRGEKKRDPDAELLARLAASKARQEADVKAIKARNTAGPMSQGKSAVRVQLYRHNERDIMLAAWHASCDRGEHAHPARPAAQDSAPRTPPATNFSTISSLSSPKLGLWTPSPPSTPKPKAKGKAKIPILQGEPSDSPLKHPRPPGQKAYAVRSGERCWVFSDLEGARDKFHRLQERGLTVEMATANGFTRAVSFAEGGGPAPGSSDAQRRREWTAAENRARRRVVAAEERRQELLEYLECYREDESEHPSDESDSGRMTDDLAEEVQLRSRYEGNWRQHRGHRGGS
ncbi:hypothetical protein B0H15DRAFT_950323 [Mycena belliarum]|uniref:Uncharacterized protein n=1 Tax=Mycena belliarum TaxID=1033014 RepID=A0AAD6XND7_9AGAR|nr:hypothetical protein B0H15DRAFT_950323 [Mycena belliae]